ncbi:MAG: sigma 54-interacting transcriptional regulator, partial [Novosphingobium sp.]
MGGLTASEATARAHAPLVQRAAAILGSGCGTATLRSKGDPVQPGPGPAVLLERGAANQLRREGQRGHFVLTYRDQTSDAALAALIAAVTPPGMPIAADPETLSILALADRLAASEIPVLVGGPTGTGKEVLSRFIHARSPRKDKPYVAVNCAAMPEAML